MNKKTERILIRICDADKARLRKAALADGRSLSAFVVRAALSCCAPSPAPLRRK